MRLSSEEREKVRSKAGAIREAAIRAGEEQDLIWDIGDLRLELLLSLGAFGGFFNVYAELLSREPRLYDPEETYLAGRRCAAAGMDRFEGFRAYLHHIHTHQRTDRYYGALYSLKHFLDRLLRELGLERMLWLYTTEYRSVYNRVIDHTRVYFDMGYDWEGRT